MLDMPELACGVAYLLEHAIYLHGKTHQGEKPRRFELHPAIMESLYMDPTFGRDQPVGMRDQFHGVPIFISCDDREARLITCHNEVQYL